MNYKISIRAASLTPSITLAVDAKAKQMKAEGVDVVGFGAGEPDFATPRHIVEAAIKALNDGFTKYTPSSGIPELRQAAADKFKRDNGLVYKPSQIIISCGGKHSCCNIDPGGVQSGRRSDHPRALLAELSGDGAAGAGHAGHHPDAATRRNSRSRRSNCARALTPRTRLFILNSPSNPTGTLYTREEIQALGDVCVENDVLIMSDEIYEKLVYDGAEHVSVAGFSPQHYEHTILVHGLAKAYSMTGWRIGMTAAPEPIAKAIDAIQSHSTSNPTSFAQKGAVAALNGPQDHLPVWLAEFARRRAYAWKKLNSIPRVSCVNAKGAFYLFPNISGLGLKSMDFCAKLLEQEKVAVVPGMAFGADDYVRISYATSMENLEKGLDRIEKFANSLHP